MNTAIRRTIVSAQKLAPIVTDLLASNLNFLVWSKQHVEIYTGMIEAVTEAGFHVVVIKNFETDYHDLYSNHPVKMIDDSVINQIADEIKSAKTAGNRVAVMFKDVERFSPRDCHFLVMALCDNSIAGVSLSENDVIFAVGNMNHEGKPDFPESLKYNNTSFDIVSNRFINYRYE